MYKLTTSSSIVRLSDGACIPADPANTDYATYLKWIANGNIPQAADAPFTESANVAILAQLLDIDQKSIRALRTGDLPRLAALEADAVLLRTKLIA
ncbi:hypothetical protein AAKU55_004906 [Oxalobacteraceae bacterium GrIS 1.11]